MQDRRIRSRNKEEVACCALPDIRPRSVTAERWRLKIASRCTSCGTESVEIRDEPREQKWSEYAALVGG